MTGYFPLWTEPLRAGSGSSRPVLWSPIPKHGKCYVILIRFLLNESDYSSLLCGDFLCCKCTPLPSLKFRPIGPLQHFGPHVQTRFKPSHRGGGGLLTDNSSSVLVSLCLDVEVSRTFQWRSIFSFYSCLRTFKLFYYSIVRLWQYLQSYFFNERQLVIYSHHYKHNTEGWKCFHSFFFIHSTDDLIRQWPKFTGK